MATTKKTTDQGDASEWDKGYRGEVQDSTPNAAYTVSGVTGGAQTPETQTPGTPGATRRDPDTSDGRKAG